MSIRHALLGLLAEQPMHGYRLKEVFDSRMSALWGLTTGQVYQSLGALERAALVESHGERKGKRPTRRVYEVTPAGRAELTTWLGRRPDRWNRPFREETLIRLMLLREADAATLHQALEQQEHDARALLVRVAHMQRDRRARQGSDTADLMHVFFESLSHHVEADIRSLQCFRDAIEVWMRQHPSSNPSEAPSI